MFKRILVAVDGSAPAARALTAALDLAVEQGSELVLLHVLDDLPAAVSVDALTYATGPILEALQQAGRDVLGSAVRKAEKRDVRLRPLLVETVGKSVSDVILDQARKTRADLIVLGTHGRRGLARIVMGSDAEGVVRNATVPVLLIRASEGAAGKRGASPRRARSSSRRGEIR
ncbi:MAG TPA: universal stress protein [Casimicrobiaceae bacterium]|nr:universal stress protein [Casimicrobiaceae bacterium]